MLNRRLGNKVGTLFQLRGLFLSALLGFRFGLGFRFMLRFGFRLQHGDLVKSLENLAADGAF